ncbi:major facilitator superfamily domain-containing protein [Aspergillus caelatus]|uniref:Major facilitator superfamily domain-containing protein n=1 Tax=Aspergillus caelatus TaxID=61420 RepID=A0A5N7A1Q2_9EURO|nr:major facilitator superfamily domain-containing protein [Aspergillus caelatus]KAE8363116.1 major facilitator superfamily domain-containing protein [Aspergillus caelatus]
MKFRLPIKPDEIPVDEKRHPDDDEANVAPQSASKETATSTVDQADDDKSDLVNPEFQHGVQSAQAMTQVWSKQHLILAYVMIWVIYFIKNFAFGIIGTLTPYVTSSFKEHSLTGTTTILSTLIGGLFKLPYAKLIDIWGRPQGFALMIACMTVGLIMMAGCNNVQTYCAAQVFYSVGSAGVDFTLTIFIADTSALKNRAFWLGFVGSPYIATVWAYGPATEDILKSMGWRWGFGIWAIVTPVMLTPLFFLFYYNQRKAQKAGLVPERHSQRTVMQSIAYYGKEFDVIGLLLLTTGLALFLLAFNLYSKQPDEWRSPLIICFIVIGGLLLIAFPVYERYIAPVTFIPWSLLLNRTVFFTYTMAASIYLAWYLWDTYFFSMLVVVFNQSVSQATYITNIYSVGSCFWAVLMGILIRYNGRLKWQALYFGVPITILGVGLMIKFREPGVNIGYIVMCQIFIAFGGGTLVICEQMTVMAVSSQQHIPAVLAMESMFINIGSAVGTTIATALWTGIFPHKLAEYLPADAQSNLVNIYGDMTVQASYPVGSAARDAINRSYSETQRLMLIAATCLYTVTLASVMMWKDVNVKKIQQVKGRIL